MSPAVVGGVGAIFDTEEHENPAKVESPVDAPCPNLGLAAKDGNCR